MSNIPIISCVTQLIIGIFNLLLCEVVQTGQVLYLLFLLSCFTSIK